MKNMGGTMRGKAHAKNCKNIDRCILNILKHRFLLAFALFFFLQLLPLLLLLLLLLFLPMSLARNLFGRCSCTGHWNAQNPWNKHRTSSVPVRLHQSFLWPCFLYFLLATCHNPSPHSPYASLPFWLIWQKAKIEVQLAVEVDYARQPPWRYIY